LHDNLKTRNTTNIETADLLSVLNQLRLAPPRTAASENEASSGWFSKSEQHGSAITTRAGHSHCQLLSKKDTVFQASTAEMPCIK
jgi:hypothetical protein